MKAKAAEPPGPTAAADPKEGRQPEDIVQETMDRALLRQKALRLALAAVAGSFVVFTIAGDRGAITLYRKWLERRTLGEQIQTLERNNARKRHDNSRLETDPRAVEKIAREELDMVKPGEIMFVLPPDPTPAAAPNPGGLTPPAEAPAPALP